jgi:hypothetical protein
MLRGEICANLGSELKGKIKHVMLKRNLADNIKTALIAIGFEDVNRT